MYSHEQNPHIQSILWTTRTEKEDFFLAMDTCSKRKVSLEGNANSGLITNINMNSKKSCTQLKNELHYEALCLKYKSTYHPPTFNKRKDERQQRLQVMRSNIYSCCEQERAMKCETPSNLSNTSCSTSVQMFSTTSNPDDSIKDSGIGISSVSIDENDIDFTCLTETITANSILYYKIQSVCVIVCVIVCLSVHLE